MQCLLQLVLPQQCMLKPQQRRPFPRTPHRWRFLPQSLFPPQSLHRVPLLLQLRLLLLRLAWLPHRFLHRPPWFPLSTRFRCPRKQLVDLRHSLRRERRHLYCQRPFWQCRRLQFQLRFPQFRRTLSRRRIPLRPQLHNPALPRHRHLHLRLRHLRSFRLQLRRLRSQYPRQHSPKQRLHLLRTRLIHHLHRCCLPRNGRSLSPCLLLRRRHLHLLLNP